MVTSGVQVAHHREAVAELIVTVANDVLQTTTSLMQDLSSVSSKVKQQEAAKPYQPGQMRDLGVARSDSAASHWSHKSWGSGAMVSHGCACACAGRVAGRPPGCAQHLCITHRLMYAARLDCALVPC